jgi:hypothetical protein
MKLKGYEIISKASYNGSDRSSEAGDFYAQIPGEISGAGFDLVGKNKLGTVTGVEVKPTLDYSNFARALGQCLVYMGERPEISNAIIYANTCNNNRELFESVINKWKLPVEIHTIFPNDDFVKSEPEPIQEDIPEIDLGVLHGKPHSEISRLKLFMEVFNGLSGIDRNDVEEQYLINELVKTGKFLKEETQDYIKKAMGNGQIYERRSGFYSRA